MKTRWGIHIKKGWSHFKLNINDCDILFHKILKFFSMNSEKHFSFGKMEWTHWEFGPYHWIFDEKALRIFISILCIHSISEWTQKTKVLILPLKFTMIFHFFRTLLITLIFDVKYLGCAIRKVIVGNWYQNLDYKLIRECVRLTYHRS